MNGHGRKLVAAVWAGLSVLLAGNAAAQDDEIVVYGTRPVTVEIDPAAMRIDVVRHRERVSTNLAATRSSEAARREPGRIAASSGRPRG
jgi:hypothetical protein